MSTQTQLASLRGALEAARLREEKHKAEIERCTRELEALRWENMNSRRGEVEVGTWFYFSFFDFSPPDGCDEAPACSSSTSHLVPTLCYLLLSRDAQGSNLLSMTRI